MAHSEIQKNSQFSRSVSSLSKFRVLGLTQLYGWRTLNIEAIDTEDAFQKFSQEYPGAMHCVSISMDGTPLKGVKVLLTQDIWVDLWANHGLGKAPKNERVHAKDPKIGDRVTIIESVSARYSNFGSEYFFEPGDVGIVGAVNVPSVHREGVFFHFVDFEKDGQELRVALFTKQLKFLGVV